MYYKVVFVIYNTYSRSVSSENDEIFFSSEETREANEDSENHFSAAGGGGGVGGHRGKKSFPNHFCLIPRNSTVNLSDLVKSAVFRKESLLLNLYLLDDLVEYASSTLKSF